MRDLERIPERMAERRKEHRKKMNNASGEMKKGGKDIEQKGKGKKVRG